MKRNVYNVYRKLSFFLLLLVFGSPFMSKSQTISTVAGNGTGGYTGDGGPATSAQIEWPYSVAADGSGGFYLGGGWTSSTTTNNRIRRVNNAGIIYTYAGTGTGGFSGDGGQATAAQIGGSTTWWWGGGGVATDATGNLYISDHGNYRIRMVNTSGIINTIAGNGGTGYTGDGGPATAAQIGWGSSWSWGGNIASDPSGNIYIYCWNPYYKIRRIDASTGIITTIAGTGTFGFSGDGGPATAANLGTIYGLAADGAGNVYMADYSYRRIRMINTSTGIITTVAGTGSTGFSGDGGPATAANITPLGVAVDGAGNINIADYGNNRIRKVDGSGTITTICNSSGAYNFTGDGGPATTATMRGPYNLCVDGPGNVYICDYSNIRIRKITNYNRPPYFTAGATVNLTVCQNTTFDSVNTQLAVMDSDSFQPLTWSLVSGSGPFHGSAAIAYISTSTGLVVTPHTLSYTPATGYSGLDTFRVRVNDGYVFDTITVYVTVNPTPSAITGPTSMSVGGYSILSSTPTTGTWSSSSTGVAPVGGGTGLVTGTSAGTATITYTLPTGCIMTMSVNVFPYAGQMITTIAGNGTAGYLTDGVAATSTRINQPWGAAADAAGNVYIADASNHRIRKVSPSGVISTFAGTGTAGFSGDGGAATAAMINHPYDVAVDAAGNVYIADDGNNRVRKVTSAGIISTIGGNGTGGFSGDGGPATAASFSGPSCVELDGSGNIYISVDGTRIRRINTSGIISTFAGNGTAGFGGDGGPATAAQLNNPVSVTYDGAGNMLIADQQNHRIRRVNSSGVISTIAGTGTGSFSGDGSAAITATLNFPWGIVVDGLGNIFIGDQLNNRVRKISGGTISTIAGNGTGAYGGDACAATASQLYHPGGLAVDNAGAIYIADVDNNRVRKVYSNRGTLFIGGRTQSLSACQNTAVSINTVMAVTDPDQGQGLTWSVLQSPVNGTLVAAYTATSNGGAVTPTGLSYTPATGFTGSDSFKVRVNDCGIGSDTTTIYVTVNPPPAPIVGASTVCPGLGTLYTDAVPGGLWSSSNPSIATVGALSGLVTGVATGTATITYSPGAGCSATKLISVNPSPAAIGGFPQICMGVPSTFTNATSGGVWSSSAPGIVTIGASDGIANGVTVGTATLTYTQGGCPAVRAVTVNPVTPPILGVPVVCHGETTLLFGSGGGTWSSSTPSVGTIAGTGLVTGISPGTTTVRYTLSTGCFASTSVLVNGLPSPITGPGSVCIGQTITLSDVTPSGVWSVSSLSTMATVDSFTGIVTGVTMGTETISYTDLVSGCSVTRGVSVNMAPPAISGTATVCIGQTTTLYNTTTGGTWSSGSGSIATVGSSGIVTGVAAGTATISYTAGGCTTTITVTVTAGAPMITGPGTVCVGLSAALTAGSGGTWSSASPGTGTIGSATGIVTGIVPGTTLITYTASGGCTSTRTITVNTSPGPILGTLTVCPGSTTALSNAISGGAWSSATPSVAGIGTSGIVTGSAPGTTVITYSLGAGCSNTATVTVNPVPSVITGALNVCVGSTTTLSSTPLGGSWSVSGTAATVISSSGVVSGSSAGTSGITYTAGGCVRTATVTVNPLPAAITGPSVACVGQPTTLSTTTPGCTWSSGTPSVATVGASSGIVTGVTPGTVTIVCGIAGTGCTRSKTMTVNPLPSAIAGPSQVCEGLSVILTCPTGGGSWSTSSSTATVGASSGVVSGISAGTAVISYTIGTGCFQTKTITINALPAAISGPSAVCVGSFITQTSASAGGSWVSTTPSVATISSSGGIVTGVATGTTLVSYTLPTGCFTTRTVSVSASPTAITGAGTVCAGASTTLGNPVGGGAWSSSTPATGTVGSLSGVVTGIAAGTTTITYSLGTGCTVTKAMTVYPSPSALTGSSDGCTGATTTLTAGTPGGTWSSSAPSTASVTGTGIVSGIAAGTATISYTIGGCAATITVTINPAPSAITGPAQVCAGAVITESNAVPGGTWSTAGTALTIGSASGDVTGVSAGTAVITYAVGVCVATRTISVNGVPVIGGSRVVCTGTGSPLTASGGGTWSSGTPGVATVGATSGIVTGITTGTSGITYTPLSGCVATTTVTVNNTPSAITGTLRICSGYTTTLSNAAGGGTWSSSSPGIASIGSLSGIVTGGSPGISTISYSLGSGCTATAAVTVNGVPSAITGPSQVCEGSTITLSNPVPGGTWSSGSTGNATVSATGVVTGVAAGSAIISYATGSGCSALRTVTVHMSAGPVSGSGNVCVGQTLALGIGTGGGTWSSGSTPIATVVATSGVVTGHIPGTSVISYTLPSGCASTKTVTVNSAPGGITGITQVCIGSATTLSNGTPGGSWNSDDPSVASIGSSGIVTGVALGTATISYSVGGCPATTVVTVNSLPSAISGPGYVCSGSSVTLTDATPGGTWSSSNTLIATAGATTGVISGLSAGTATISYSMGAGCTVSAAITVRPLPLPITGSTNLCIGATTPLASGTPGGVWSSTTPSVATISTSGAVTAVSSGVSVISYLSPSTGCAATAAVNVIVVPAISGIADLCAWGDTLSITNANMGGVYSSSLVTVLNLGGGNGLVTSFAPGTGTITYTLGGSGCSVTAPITINPLPGPVTGNTRLCVGLTTTLGNSTPGGVWSSSSTGAATIGSSTGIVSGLAPGTERITYTLQPSGCFTDTIVIVSPQPSAISGSSQLCAGTTVTLTDTTSGGVWTSSHPSVATATGTGAGTATVSGITAGAVTVTYTMGASCMATKTLTVNALPFVYTVSGGGNYCSGGAGLHVLLGGSQMGIDYQLYNGASATGTPLAGTTTGLDFGAQTAAGTYMVLATNAATSCSRSMTGSANITITPSVIPAVTLSATPGTNLCAGTAVTYTATGFNGGSGPVYQWQVNGVTISGTTSTSYGYTPVNGDVIKAILTSNAVCANPDTASGSVTMTVNNILVPVVTITAVPGTSVITGKPDTFTAVVVNGGPSPTYQWKVNGVPIAAATGPVFIWSTFATGDVVTCEVVSSGPCGGQSDVSNALTITVTPDPVVGVRTVSGEGVVQVQPNPNKGAFTIKGTLGVATEEEVTIEITNMLGQVVYKDRVVKQNGRLNEQVKLGASLANGMYMLNLRSDSEQKVFHIVVEQ